MSVDHPRVVETYREGHRLFEKTSGGDGTTEDLRLAMRSYRKLFVELVEEGDPDAETADDRETEAARR